MALWESSSLGRHSGPVNKRRLIVPRCDSAIHIGNLLNTKNTRNAMIEHSIKEFNKSFYGFISKFDGCNTTVKSRLFHQYWASMYHSQLWDLSKQNLADRVHSQYYAHFGIFFEH